MVTKRPMIKQTVGALYLAFNTPDEKGEFDLTKFEETIKSEVVKTIDTTESAESTVVRASGREYTTADQISSVEQSVEVVAFDPGDLARMRGDNIGKNLVKSGAPAQKPYFAFGKVVKKVGGAVEFVWYPKCKLQSNTDNIQTSEENFNEQNDTIVIKAYSFDDEGNKSVRINSEMKNFPEGLTEEQFFTKPITSDTEIETLVKGA